CMCTVPLGMPVEPDEYSQKHASSQVVGAGAQAVAALDIRSCKDNWPFASLPDTITCLRNGSLSARCSKRGAKVGSNCSDTTSALARLSLSMNSESAGGGREF